MNYRPKHTQRDLNHYIVKDVSEDLGLSYGGLPIYLVDVSDKGGEMLDWLLWLGGLCIAIEVKTEEAFRLKDHRLKPGESAFIAKCPGPKAIVVTEQDVADLLAKWYSIAKLIPIGG